MGAEESAFELLAALTARQAGSAELDEIVDTVLAEIAHLGFGAVWLATLDEASGNLVMAKEVIDGVDTTHALPRSFVLDMRQPIGHGFRERRMINVKDPDALLVIEGDEPVPADRLALPRAIYDHLRGHPFACGPLLGSLGQPVGAIGLSSYQGNKPIPDELFEHGLLRALMNHLAIAMERATNVARLERLDAELLAARAVIENTARIKALGELATAIAHDLNNLSGVALLAVSTGMQSPQAAHDALPRIERANRMIGELVGRLQHVAREANCGADGGDDGFPQPIIAEVLADAPAACPSLPISDQHRARIRRGSVFAIDDDEDILGVVSAYLETLGFEVITTTDAAHVLAMVAARHFDVVLCDVSMPKHNGLELCQLLRQRGYRGKLVLMTGWDTHRVERDQRAQDCDLLLKKPFLGAELVHAIDKLLARPARLV